MKNTIPKENGYYWLRRKEHPDMIVKIWDIEEGIVEYGASVAWSGSDWDSSLCDVCQDETCLWSGPLVAPEK